MYAGRGRHYSVEHRKKKKKNKNGSGQRWQLPKGESRLPRTFTWLNKMLLRPNINYFLLICSKILALLFLLFIVMLGAQNGHTLHPSVSQAQAEPTPTLLHPMVLQKGESSAWNNLALESSPAVKYLVPSQRHGSQQTVHLWAKMC